MFSKFMAVEKKSQMHMHCLCICRFKIFHESSLRKNFDRFFEIVARLTKTDCPTDLRVAICLEVPFRLDSKKHSEAGFYQKKTMKKNF